METTFKDSLPQGVVMERRTPVLFRYVRPLLALIFVLGSFSFLFIVTKKPIPEGNVSIVSQAQGYILAVLGIVMGYYFGSSKDKSDEDQRKSQPNTTVSSTTTTEVIK